MNNCDNKKDDLSPEEWVVVDTNGIRGLLDFVELYKSEPDKFGRKFRDSVLEEIFGKITKYTDIVCIDNKEFEEIHNFVVECKLKFLCK